MVNLLVMAFQKVCGKEKRSPVEEKSVVIICLSADFYFLLNRNNSCRSQRLIGSRSSFVCCGRPPRHSETHGPRGERRDWLDIEGLSTVRFDCSLIRQQRVGARRLAGRAAGCRVDDVLAHGSQPLRGGGSLQCFFNGLV